MLIIMVTISHVINLCIGSTSIFWKAHIVQDLASEKVDLDPDGNRNFSVNSSIFYFINASKRE